MKNVHPCTFFIDECETKPQTSLLYGTSGIRAAFACEVERQRAVEQCASVYLSTDVRPCTSVEDKFCAQNLLLFGTTAVRGTFKN